MSISDREDLETAVAKMIPSAIFFTPIQWLDPVHLRLTRERVRDCMLTSPLFFDIDTKTPKVETQASTEVVWRLTDAIRGWSDRMPDMLVFSGKSGFHVYYWNWDDIPTRHEHLAERIEAFRRSRKKLLRDLRVKGVQVDESVTADPWRVLRLPGSLHWDTGLIACLVSNLKKFNPQRDAVAFPLELYQEVFGLDLSRV